MQRCRYYSQYCQAHHQRQPESWTFPQTRLCYDKERDVYHCPGGAELEYRFDTVELGRHIRYYKATACKNCPLKDRCTQNTEGRRITRWVDEGILEEMAERLAKHPEYRIERSSFVEHPFGTLQRGMNQGYFLLKGLQKVKGEFS